MKTPIFNIHDLILVLTSVVCLLLVVFYWVLARQKTISARFLSGFFLGVGISALCNLLLWSDSVFPQSVFSKHLLLIGLVGAIIGKSVCLYFYVLSITKEQFSLNRFHTFHLMHLFVIPVVLLAGLTVDHLRFLPGNYTEYSVMLINGLWNYLKCLPMLYAFAAAWQIRRYKQQLKNFYSSLQLDGPWWLFILTMGFALNWAWSLIVHLLGQSINSSISDSFGIIDNYLTFFLVNALFIYSLLYAHQLLHPAEKPREREVTQQQVASDLDIQSIRDAMEKYQLYLKPNLTIEEFAKQVGIHYREVSSIINKEFNTNFFEFVNEYRVKKAKSLLQDPANAERTILEILLESGFNSKSSFHRFFKRYTGMSAADFRKGC